FVPLKRAKKWFSVPQAILSSQPVTTAYFGSARLRTWIDRLLSSRAIDRTVVFSSAMTPYVLENRKLDTARGILDLGEFDSDKWRQYAARSGGIKRWIFGREARLLLRLERRAARAFKATLLASPYEAKSFASMAPESASRIGAINNGVNQR